MKKLIMIAAAMLLTISAFAQNGKAIYQKYSDEPGVDAVYISPAMFKLIGNLPISYDEQEIDLASIVKSLSGFYLLSVENSGIADKVAADVNKYVKSNKFELMMEAKSDGDKMTIYTVTEGDYITSLVMVATEPDETSFICLDGRILSSDLDKMIASIDK